LKNFNKLSFKNLKLTNISLLKPSDPDIQNVDFSSFEIFYIPENFNLTPVLYFKDKY
jgi:hypothetical protein